MPGARQIYERWMSFEPDHHGWMSYIKVGPQPCHPSRSWIAFLVTGSMQHSDIMSSLQLQARLQMATRHRNRAQSSSQQDRRSPMAHVAGLGSVLSRVLSRRRWRCATKRWTGRATSLSATCAASPPSGPTCDTPSSRCATATWRARGAVMSALWKSWARMLRLYGPALLSMPHRIHHTSTGQH